MSTPIIIPCTADCYLRSGQPTLTYGSATSMICGFGSGATIQMRRVCMKFPAASVASMARTDIFRVLLRWEIVTPSGNAFAYSIFGLQRDKTGDFNDMSWNRYDQSGALAWDIAGGDVDDSTQSDLLAPTSIGIREDEITETFLDQLENLGGFDHFAFIAIQANETMVFNFAAASLENGAGKVVPTLLVYPIDTGGASKKVSPPFRTRRRGT